VLKQKLYGKAVLRRENLSRKDYFDRITEPSDYVEESCKTCKFNFSDQGICAAHDSLFGYGEKITDCNATCDQWMISLEAFSEERERYYETGISKTPKHKK
jgi:sulfatase maturation enzyme AslB (radical SAM superfamily)